MAKTNFEFQKRQKELEKKRKKEEKKQRKLEKVSVLPGNDVPAAPDDANDPSPPPEPAVQDATAATPGAQPAPHR